MNSNENVNGVMVFESEEFGRITTISINNKEHFAATQVAKILGYSNPRKAIIDHCFEDGVTFCDVIDNIGRNQRMKFIDEGNLYALIMKSKLPNTKKFRKWICTEVIPSIRKHGVYMTDDVLDEALKDPSIINKLLYRLKSEQEEKIVAQQRSKDLEEHIIINKPYTNLGKSISKTDGAITMGEYAKLLNNKNIRIGRNRLYQWLRENKYLISKGKEKNRAKQAYIEQGLFQVEERIVKTSEGDKLSVTTLITGKGQLYFLDKF